MKLIKVVNNIGVYIDIEEKKVYDNALKIIERQLKGFNSKGKVEYSLILKDYNILSLNDMEGTIVPHNSINTIDKFINLRKRRGHLAYKHKVANREFVIWIDEDSRISIPYFIHFLFKKQGLYFVHSAGIGFKGEGILLPAFGGIGKTIFMAEALRHKDTKLLGDDLTLLASDGKVYAYERPFCLYEYHKPLFPQYFDDNKVIYKEKTLFNRIVRKVQEKFGFQEYILDYELAPPNQLFEEDKFLEKGEGITLNKVVLLRRKLNIDSITAEETNINFVTSFITNVMFHEWWMYLRMEYRWLAENGIYRSSYLNEYEKNIKKGLNHIDKFKIINIPVDMGPEIVSKELIRLILE